MAAALSELTATANPSPRFQVVSRGRTVPVRGSRGSREEVLHLVEVLGGIERKYCTSEGFQVV